MISGGLADKQIAARLHLSHRTVEKHVESLLRKTGARSRTGLVAAASQAAARDPQRAFSSLGHYVVPAGIYVLFPM